ncbi:unnamed protein product [Mycena citricolor]|uniref:Uncharacterized protein n=1 Tax=Mycena citricolor TaxID=2018698 RepID=A0AAD2GR15_9AGAR|nr:unnamed protein product [Mycena citricolor]
MSTPKPLQTSLPGRDRVPSAKVLDKNNGEAPNARHKRGMTVKHVLELVKEISHLVPRLPDTVPGPDPNDNKILCLLSSKPSEDDTTASLFNRRFDVLFGEDCRNDAGRMIYVRRGEDGMDLVVTYLNSIQWESDNNLLGIAPIKLEQMVTELRHLCSTGNPPSEKPKGKKAPGPRPLTDLERLADAILDTATGKKGRGKKKAATTTTNASSDNDSDYLPRAPNNASEEEEDDFELTEIEDLGLPTPRRPQKHLLVDGKAAPAPSKRAKKMGAAAKTGPAVEVIDIDEDEDDNLAPGLGGKQGPKSDTLTHFRPPRAIIATGGSHRWEFVCLHCGEMLRARSQVNLL